MILTITKARYKLSRNDDFSRDILVDAAGCSKIRETPTGGGAKDRWGNNTPTPVVWSIGLNGITESRGKELSENTDQVYWQLEVNTPDGKEVWETKAVFSPVYPTCSGYNIAFRIGKDFVRSYTV